MAGQLQHEIRQKSPFSCIEEEAFLNIQRTSDMLWQELGAVLRPTGLSATQYNVLRILRGAGDAGTCCKDIGERMVTSDPDVTRLIDRLQKRGLVTRSRAPGDRRFVTIRITEHGLLVLGDLDRPVVEVTTRCLGHMGAERLGSLIALLEAARAR